MRLPTWEEFLEKERMWQKHIHQQMKEKISGIVKEHPLLDMAFEAYLIFLPPPLGTIAQNIYNNAKGSENDRVNAVLKYFDELKEEGQEHYEIVANKIDSTLVGIQDLKDIGNSIFKIQELLIEEIRDIDRKIDDIKRVLKADHSAIMQPRWEKEKNAFVIGEGLMSNLMSSYNQKEKRTLADHMFFDLCTNIGPINLNGEEISIIFDPYVGTVSKLLSYYNFRRRVDLILDRDVACPLMSVRIMSILETL